MEWVGINRVGGQKTNNMLIGESGPKVLLLALCVGLSLLGIQGYVDSRILAGGVDPLGVEVGVNTGADSDTLDLAAIIALNMMGGATGTAASTATIETIPDTRLDLQLHGIFASNGERLAGAVIAQARGESGFYRIGDEIADDVSLHAVAADSVVLKRGGALETLRYPEKTDAAATTPRVASRRVRGDNVANQEVTPPGTGDGGSSEQNNQRATQLRERLQQLRQRSAE